MRHKGNTGYYQEERNHALVKAFQQNLHTRGAEESLQDYVSRVINMPAPSYFITTERTGIVIARMAKGLEPSVSGAKLEMYRDIYDKVKELRSRTKMSLRDAVRKVISSPAPRFYMTPLTALREVYKYKQKIWQSRRKRRI